MIDIKPLTIENMDECGEIISMNYPDSPEKLSLFLNEFSNDPKFFRGLFEDGQLIAFAGFELINFDFDGYGLYWVNVKDGFKGRGYAYKLYNMILSEIKSMHDEPTYLILSCSPKLKPLYERFGLRVAANINDTRFIMIKVI